MKLSHYSQTLAACEAYIDALVANIQCLGPTTVDVHVVKKTIRRLKFFFNHRYAYGRHHVAGPAASAYGIEATRDAIPPWVQEYVESVLVEAGLLPVGFINSACINVYYGFGLHSHMDDPKRFARAIYSLRLFGDSRLTFGAHGLGMNNAFCSVAMPRGSVTILEENSYAADAITHCVRHQDVKGKSAAVLLRFMKSV